MALNFNLLLQKYNAQGVLINTNDEFLSEFTAKENNVVYNLLGFGGSNAVALITGSKNYFFTDGRYLLQAKMQVGSEFEIVHINNFESVIAGIGIGKILLDKRRFSAKFCLNLSAKIPKMEFIAWNEDVVAKFAHKGNYYKLPQYLTGENESEKLAKLRLHMKAKNMNFCYVTDCQNVCWLLNIRGEDEQCTPVYKTHLLVTMEGLELMPNLQRELNGRIMIDDQINMETYNLIAGEKYFDNFLTKQKALKNGIEIDGIKNAHKIDGKILTKFLLDIENSYKGLNEFDIGVKLLNARKMSDHFVCQSFETICGYNENGAIIHYNAVEKTAKNLDDGVLLLDSGGQYCNTSGIKPICGTTDVTRTIYLGTCNNEEYKKVFTLVLKGHIAVAMAEFEYGTTGREIDVLARKHLIEAGLKYDHGTGHGVGAFLSVHEGGVSISPRSQGAIEEGMLVSNEPGCYIEGKFGVRIESLVIVVKKKPGLLGFETITFVPIQERSVNFNILTLQEQQWLKSYNDIAMENGKS